MTSRSQKNLFATAFGLVATWSLVFVAYFGMCDMLKDFKVECPALTLLTFNLMHVADSLLLPCAVVAVAILLCRRISFSWYGALALCLLCDVMALGIALPLIILSNTVGTPPHPAQLPLWTAMPLVVLTLNQLVLVLLFVKRREFFTR